MADKDGNSKCKLLFLGLTGLVTTGIGSAPDRTIGQKSSVSVRSLPQAPGHALCIYFLAAGTNDPGADQDDSIGTNCRHSQGHYHNVHPFANTPDAYSRRPAGCCLPSHSSSADAGRSHRRQLQKLQQLHWMYVFLAFSAWVPHGHMARCRLRPAICRTCRVKQAGG